MFAKHSILALLSAPALIAAFPAGGSYATDQYEWTVTDFYSKCGVSDCNYSFNVSAGVGPRGQPAFEALFCSGRALDHEYKFCGQVGVDAETKATVETQEWHIGGEKKELIVGVKYSFTDAQNTRYSYYANKTVFENSDDHTTYKFVMIPDKVTAVA